MKHTRMKTNTQILIHLSLIQNVGPSSVLKIITRLHKKSCESHANPQLAMPNFNLENLYRYNISDFRNTFGFSMRVAELITNGLKSKKITRARDKFNK